MKRIILTLGILWIIGAKVSNASGIIIPEPPKHGELYPQALTIKDQTIEVSVLNQVAKTKVDQVFVNPFPYDLEGTYIFPIPEGAALSGFSLWVGGEELKGEVLNKEEAQRIYEDIVRRMKDPGLLEFLGRGAFKARIYPIPARGEKRVSLEYEEILFSESGVSQYRYTLGTDKFSADPVGKLNLSFALSSKVPIKSVYSPTHEIEMVRKGDHRVEIHYSEKNKKSEGDFLLYYAVSKEDLGLNLLTYREKGDKGFFLGLISPSSLLTETRVIGKDIVFVLDRSGSMNGEKIEQAKSALLFCLNSLNPKDRYSLITFNDEIHLHSVNLVEASIENIKNARNSVKGIEAAGGTNIQGALLTALQQSKNTQRTVFVIFLTDGLPTVGETDIQTILNNVKEKSKEDTRIFAFGVGYDVNTQFLDRLSSENEGTTDYVRPEEDIEVKVSNFYSKISNPILTDLTLDFGTIQVSEIYPKVLPDLFHGSQLIILGRYEGKGKTKILLSGMSDEGKKGFTYEGNFSPLDENHNFIPRLWASRKIGYLIEEIRSHGENKELVDEIVRLSKKYGIMTEYTSFLVEEDETVAMHDLQRRASEGMSRAAEPKTGGWAVNQSINARILKEGTRVASKPSFYDAKGQAEEVGGVTQRRERTFFNKRGNWVDSEFEKDRSKIQVKRFSRAYYQLMERDNRLGEYLSLGDRVLFNLGDSAIQIDDLGKEEFTETELNRLFQ